MATDVEIEGWRGLPAARAADHIDGARRQGRSAAWWAAMIAEAGALFDGRGADEAAALRAHILAGFGPEELPPALVNYALEDLAFSRDPRALAAAARAIRFGPASSAGARALSEALYRIAPADAHVRLWPFGAAPSREDPTAAQEVLATLAHWGASSAGERERLAALPDHWSLSPPVSASLRSTLEAIPPRDVSPCCRSAAASSATRSEPLAPATLVDLAEVMIEDQSGERCGLGQLLSGAPSLLAFFYTRCMTPEKCSLTISQLGQVRQRLHALAPAVAVNIVGMTYDPDYDVPSRLLRFGEHRSVPFGPRTRLVRVVGDFSGLRAGLDLGVGYGPSTINHHRIEMMLVRADLSVAASHIRAAWDPAAAATALLGLADEAPRSRLGHEPVRARCGQTWPDGAGSSGD